MRDEKQYLHDILDAARTISEQISGVTYEAFLDSTLLQHSMLFNFAVIGEAASKLSSETRTANSEIDWGSIIGFRNTIVHAYFSLTLQIVWNAATRHLPSLSEHVAELIRHKFGDDDGANLD